MQAQEFEEIATMEFPFEGIPTVPPRKDMDRMVKIGCKCPLSAHKLAHQTPLVSDDHPSMANCCDLTNKSRPPAASSHPVRHKAMQENTTLCSSIAWQGASGLHGAAVLSLQAFFCSGCRYRVTAYPDWSVEKVMRPASNLPCRNHSRDIPA